MKNIFTPILIIISLSLSACNYMDKYKLNKQDPEEPKNLEIDKIQKKDDKKLTISQKCGEDITTKLLEEGWVIKSEKIEQVVCSWKTTKSSPDCNIELDKGCKITIPDKSGEKYTYELERE